MGVHGASLLAALLGVDGTTPALPTSGGPLYLILGAIVPIATATIGAAAVWRRRRRGDDLDEVSAFTKALTVEVNFAAFRRRTNRRIKSLEQRVGAAEQVLGELQAARRPKGTSHAHTPAPD